MNAREAISELESIKRKSETFKLDMFDRARINDIIKWLNEGNALFEDIVKKLEVF